MHQILTILHNKKFMPKNQNRFRRWSLVARLKFKLKIVFVELNKFAHVWNSLFLEVFLEFERLRGRVIFFYLVFRIFGVEYYKWNAVNEVILAEKLSIVWIFPNNLFVNDCLQLIIFWLGFSLDNVPWLIVKDKFILLYFSIII